MKYPTFEDYRNSDDYKSMISAFGSNGITSAIAMIVWQAAREETEAEVLEKLATP
jgi:hypothetical protein